MNCPRSSGTTRIVGEDGWGHCPSPGREGLCYCPLLLEALALPVMTSTLPSAWDGSLTVPKSPRPADPNPLHRGVLGLPQVALEASFQPCCFTAWYLTPAGLEGTMGLHRQAEPSVTLKAQEPPRMGSVPRPGTVSQNLFLLSQQSDAEQCRRNCLAAQENEPSSSQGFTAKWLECRVGALKGSPPQGPWKIALEKV